MGMFTLRLLKENDQDVILKDPIKSEKINVHAAKENNSITP